MSEKSKTYYHYTSAEGVAGIMEEKLINPSTDTVRDAMMGEGTYFTKQPPHVPAYTLAKNNYGSPAAARQGLREDKLRFAIKLEFTKNADKFIKSYEGSRDVHMFPGPIDLDDRRQVKSYKVIERFRNNNRAQPNP